MDETVCDIPESPTNYVDLISHQDGLTRFQLPYKARCAVIGAGASGLVAAYELIRVGIEPVIYEASDRIGGRLYSYRFPGDPHAIAELGAMRFPPTALTLGHYIKAFGLQTQAFPDPLVAPTALYVNNERHVCHGEAELPEPLQHVAKKWTDLIDRIVQLEQRESSDVVARRKLWQEQIDRYANVSFYQVLAHNGWSPAEISLFGSLGLGTGGFDSLYNISFLEIIRMMHCRWEVDQKLIKGGVEQLAARLWDARRECRRFGETSVRELNHNSWRPGVCSIATKGDRIRISDCKGGVDSFEAAILTCALPAIEANIEISPGIFSPEVMKAIRCVHHVGSSKVFVRTREAFWKDDRNFPRCAITDEITRGTYLFDFDDSKSGVICLSYTWEDASKKILPLTPQQKVDACLQKLERVLGVERFRSQIEEIFTISWEQMPHYHGAFKLNYPGQYMDQLMLFNQNRATDPAWDRGVYLAGDSVSFSGGWVEGALQTGIQAAVSAINHCVGLAT
jgi:lysine 2-monooxygenase